MSIASAVTQSITWHFFESAKKHELDLSTQAKTALFFAPIVITKVLVMSTLTVQLNAMEYHQIATLAPSLMFLIYQFGIVTWAFPKMESSLSTALANLTSIRRPSHDKDEVENVIHFYKVETVGSSVICLIWTILSYLISSHQPGGVVEPIFSYIGVTLVSISFLLTQLYLRTDWGIKLLFPETDADAETDAETEINLKAKEENYRKSKKTPNRKDVKTSSSPKLKLCFVLTSTLLTVAAVIITPIWSLSGGNIVIPQLS